VHCLRNDLLGLCVERDVKLLYSLTGQKCYQAQFRIRKTYSVLDWSAFAIGGVFPGGLLPAGPVDFDSAVAVDDLPGVAEVFGWTLPDLAWLLDSATVAASDAMISEWRQWETAAVVMYMQQVTAMCEARLKASAHSATT